jgi:hypothetical protein
MKKVIVSKPLKGISTSGNYLVVEIDSGVVSIKEPRYIGLHPQPGILDLRDIVALVGTLFFLLVIGVFLDYFNQLPLAAWYGFAILLIGLLLIALLIAPRRSVLVIEAGDKTYYFTRPQGVDERTIKEIVTRIHFDVQTASDKAMVDNSSKVS